MNIDPIHQHLSPVWPQQTDNMTHEDRFPGTGGTQDDGHLSFGNRKIHTLQNGLSVERLMQVFYLNHLFVRKYSRSQLVKK